MDFIVQYGCKIFAEDSKGESMDKIVYEISDGVFLSFRIPKKKLKLWVGTEEIDRKIVILLRPHWRSSWSHQLTIFDINFL